MSDTTTPAAQPDQATRARLWAQLARVAAYDADALEDAGDYAESDRLDVLSREWLDVAMSLGWADCDPFRRAP